MMLDSQVGRMFKGILSVMLRFIFYTDLTSILPGSTLFSHESHRSA